MPSGDGSPRRSIRSSPRPSCAPARRGWRGSGCPRPKSARSRRSRARSSDDELALAALAELPAEEAHAALTAVHGIGPWTADIYLLSCLGHADAWPAGDLALQEAAPRRVCVCRTADRQGDAGVWPTPGGPGGRSRPESCGPIIVPRPKPRQIGRRKRPARRSLPPNRSAELAKIPRRHSSPNSSPSPRPSPNLSRSQSAARSLTTRRASPYASNVFAK